MVGIILIERFMGLITYLLIGVVWAATTDLMNDFVSVRRVELDSYTRLLTVLLWPIAFSIWMYAFCKEYFK